MDKKPSVAKKSLSRNKYRRDLMSSFQKTKATQTSGSVLQKALNKLKTQNMNWVSRNKYRRDLMSSFQKTKATQTSGSVLQKALNKYL